MARRMSMRAAEAKIRRLTERIGKDRDALNALIEELEPLRDTCNDALESLEYAADKLSEYA
jgi:hypothetical protein